MKEMIQSKTLIGFVVIVLSFVFINSMQVQKLEEAKRDTQKNIIVMNIK